MDRLIWEKTSEGNARLLGVTDTPGELVLPKKIEGLPLTEVGPYCFAKNKYLERVVLPDSIVKIDSGLRGIGKIDNKLIYGKVYNSDNKSIIYEDDYSVANQAEEFQRTFKALLKGDVSPSRIRENFGKSIADFVINVV